MEGWARSKERRRAGVGDEVGEVNEGASGAAKMDAGRDGDWIQNSPRSRWPWKTARLEMRECY